LIDAVKCKTVLYADDTSLLCRAKDDDDLKIQLQSNLCTIANWFKANKLTLNDSFLNKYICCLYLHVFHVVVCFWERLSSCLIGHLAFPSIILVYLFLYLNVQDVMFVLWKIKWIWIWIWIYTHLFVKRKFDNYTIQVYNLICFHNTRPEYANEDTSTSTSTSVLSIVLLLGCRAKVT
jgi:hypothetical protein